MSNICQSCGMPLSRDPKKGGTEADGSLSKKYCSLCYHEGKFIEPYLTLEQMMEKVELVLKRDMHLPGFLAAFFSRRTKKLGRWRR